MKTHHRNYKLFNVTLCGIDIHEAMKSSDIAFAWADIERINCMECRDKREEFTRNVNWSTNLPYLGNC